MPALAAREKSQGDTAVAVPPATAPGNYFVIAATDAGGSVAETDESNNHRARALVVTP